MITAQFNFQGQYAVRRGSTTNWTFTFKDAQGSAIDLSNYSVSSEFAKSIDEDSTRYPITVAIVNPATNGQVTFTLPASTTAPLDPGVYVYDILFDQGGGLYWRAIEGEIHLVGGVTSA